MTIGIIGAMDEETQEISKYMTLQNNIYIGSIHFMAGSIEGVETVIVQSGIGKVNSSIACAILIEKYNPDLIINIGSAGGIGKEKNIGDIVISNRVRYHDVDATVIGCTRGQIPLHPEYYEADKNLVNITETAVESAGLGRYFTGEILSGDTFVSSEKLTKTLIKDYPDTIAVEMEAGGLAQCCHILNKPFIIIRALSDIAGNNSGIEFNDFLHTAARKSGKLVLEIILTLKDRHIDMIDDILDGKNS